MGVRNWLLNQKNSRRVVAYSNEKIQQRLPDCGPVFSFPRACLFPESADTLAGIACLAVPQLGVREMGVAANPRISEKNLFPAISDCPRRCSESATGQIGRERAQKAEKRQKGRKGSISVKGGQAPLKPPSSFTPIHGCPGTWPKQKSLARYSKVSKITPFPAQRSSTQRNHWESIFPKLAWILAPEVACIWLGFFGARKAWLKNSGRFRDRIVTKSCKIWDPRGPCETD